MREIKFRGQRVDGKGWVYGSLDYNKYNNLSWIKYERDKPSIEVYTKSVAQFTGLQDKNKEDIYESDIVTYYGEEREYVIVYDKAMFEGFSKDSNHLYLHVNLQYIELIKEA